ncbi:MAG: helix-turn-helix domain-containing protein [Thermoanaerobaculia bacterium]
MSILGARLDEAIKASGKTQKQVASEAKTSEKTISQIINGAHENPSYDLLVRLADATFTSVEFLVGGSMVISPHDESELLRHRQWIDGKLQTLDARKYANAKIVERREAPQTKELRIADRKSDVTLVLRAIGDSMRDAGVVDGDLLHAVSVPRKRESLVGKIVACKLNGAIFVKRFVLQHDRVHLVSANPRYRDIAIDEEHDKFDILGVVITRSGDVN